MRKLGWFVSSMMVVLVGCGASTDDGQDNVDTTDEDLMVKQALLVDYDTTGSCEIFINEPGTVANRSWTMTEKRITWRYNVDETWALVSDPARARAKEYPWWGFTKRSCIVGEPDRVLEGRSHVTKSGWRSVEKSVPAAAVTEQHHAMSGHATLRDHANFVIGNVEKGWHVDVTDHTRSSGFWVEVYVPNANRWGYVTASDLDGQ